MNDGARRRQLADFLRSRRGRLRPEDVGLPRPLRSRTPGLRRDDVAQLAGVSVSWYTWLEQARNIHVSPQTVMRLAGALRLDDTETTHVLGLARPERPSFVPTRPDAISPTLRRVIALQGGNPAYVLNERWDVLIWNQASHLLFGDFARDRFGESNALRFMFLDPLANERICDWQRQAGRMAAQFRSACDHFAGDPAFELLITDLRQGSSEFERAWATHDVMSPTVGRKDISHPQLGHLRFEHSVFAVNEDRRLRMVVYVPVEDQETACRMRRALARLPSP